MSRYSSSLANLVNKLSWTNKVGGFVLFNRYYCPDININTIALKSAPVLSTPDEHVIPLRWIALLSSQIDQGIAASTGVHDHEGLIKQLLAGASAVQTVSAMYKHGAPHLKVMLEGLEQWMEEQKLNSLSDFKGKLSYDNADNPAAYERIQFMKYYGGIH